MDRRIFLRSALTMAGAAAAAAVVLPGPAQAASLFDTLKDMEANPAGAVDGADLPAETATEVQYWGGRPGWRGRRWGGRPRGRAYGWRPRARRCFVRRNRWGRVVRVCA